jgi:hypothetical protein
MQRPWYKEPYVWLIILFPATAVIAGSFTLYLAISSDDGLVVDDYYKQGLAINRVLERDKTAEIHGLKAHLSFIGDKFINLQLDANPDYQLPAELRLNFSHHTRSGFDKIIKLKRMSNNSYQGKMPSLILGEWTIEIEADDWRLLESLYKR